MNLLTIKNRFTETTSDTKGISERNGYIMALTDILEFLKIKTGSNPDNRMIDVVDILDAIIETNDQLTKQARAIHGDIMLEKIRYGTEDDIPPGLFNNDPKP